MLELGCRHPWPLGEAVREYVFKQACNCRTVLDYREMIVHLHEFRESRPVQSVAVTHLCSWSDNQHEGVKSEGVECCMLLKVPASCLMFGIPVGRTGK